MCLGSDYCMGMRAIQLLKGIKALSAGEREELLMAILRIEDRTSIPPRKSTGRVKWPDVEARAKRILGGRVLPNLVLLEREEAWF